MQTNSNVEFNLGKFNVPTIAGILTIMAMLLNMTNNRTERDTKVDLRLDSIESSRAAAKVENQARLVAIETQLSSFSNVTYRITSAEASILATNLRLDRQSDAIGKLSDGISEVSSDLKLLTQRLEIAVPLKKSELDGIPFGQTPRELKQ